MLRKGFIIKMIYELNAFVIDCVIFVWTLLAFGRLFDRTIGIVLEFALLLMLRGLCVEFASTAC